MRLHLKGGHKAASRGICKVPVCMQEGFAEEVKNMMNQGIIRWMRDDKHSEWVNSYVLVTKKAPHGTPENIVSAEKVGRTDVPAKRIRVCLDHREWNEALVREPYYTWSVDELTTKFHGIQYFSIVNIKKGLWQVELHPDSQIYTAMSLPSGRYVWTRLFNGLSAVMSSRKRLMKSTMASHILQASQMTWSSQSSLRKSMTSTS